MSFLARMMNELEMADPRYYIQSVLETWQTTDTGYVLEVAVAGYSKSELDLRVSPRALSVSGKRAEKNVRFFQSWPLPQDAAVSTVKAKVDNGLLTVTVDRVDPLGNSRRVTIE